MPTTFYWKGNVFDEPNQCHSVEEVLNYRTGSFAGPVAAVLPTTGDTVMVDGIGESVNPPSGGISLADWIGTNGAHIIGGTYYGAVDLDYTEGVAEYAVFFGSVLAMDAWNCWFYSAADLDETFSCIFGSGSNAIVNQAGNTRVLSGGLLQAVDWFSPGDDSPTVESGGTLLCSMMQVVAVIASAGYDREWYVELTVQGRISFDYGNTYVYSPNSAWTAPANKVVSGTSNLGTAGTVTLPAIGNVRNNVGFGAAGTQFTGNVVIPPEAKVEDGFDYGAAGTEFEGSLEAAALLPVTSVRARVDRGDGEFGTFVGDTPVQEIFPPSGTPATVALTTTFANALTITPSSPINKITLRVNTDADVNSLTLEVLAKQTPNHSGETVVNADNIASQLVVVDGAYPVPASTETIVRIQVPRAYSYVIKAKDKSVTATPSATFDAVV